MKEFIEGFKEMYCDMFSLIYSNRKDMGKLFALISMIIILVIFFAIFFKFCDYLGRLEARKAYTVEVYNSELYEKENSRTNLC